MQRRKNERLLGAATWIAVVSVAACGGSPEVAAPREDSATTSPAPEPSVRPLDEVLVAELDIEGADWLASEPGGVWTRLERAQAVVRVDPDSNESGEPIELGPGFCEGLGAGPDAVWACSGGALAQIDPRTERVEATFDVDMDQDEGLIGVGEGAVWVLEDPSGSEWLLRIDPSSGRLLAEIPLGHPGTEVAVGLGSVWVSSSDGVLLRVDPGTERVVAEVPDLPQARFVVAGEGSVWVSYSEGLARVDPVANEVVASVDEPIGLSGGLAVGGGSLWIRSSVSFLSRLDLATNEVVETFDPGEDVGGGSVLYAFDSVWATAYDSNRLWRLDP